MTDDLVKRLRKVEPDAPGERTRWYRNPDGPEAADRIEQLEAALREIADQIEKYDLPAEVVTWFVLQKARKALEGKDD